jgi:para-aminobenzoate synthetase component 1
MPKRSLGVPCWYVERVTFQSPCRRIGHTVNIQRIQVEQQCRPRAYLRAVAGRPYPALLESAQAGLPFGRWSILCWDPFRRITCRGRAVEVDDLRSGMRTVSGADPFRVLSREFAPLRIAAPVGFDLPFVGGAVGYLSYDLRHRIERLPRSTSYDVPTPEFDFCLYDRALVFDHLRGVTEWVGPAGVDPDLPSPLGGPAPDVRPVALKANFTREEYLRAVRRVKDYIAAGDIFQVNLSQRFAGACPSEGVAVYCRLQDVNPAPFAAYLKYPELEVISSSPERFLLVEGDRVTTRPIKGTRPRAEGDDAFNRRMRAELAASEKDHAELTMIVDLERNDLGRVCRYGTVRVEEHAVIEEYPTVFHLVSTVSGELYREGSDEFSLVRATFPGGSITGAPKIRAMEIIEELEPHARGVYTGAIGYVSFHGRMDLNIAIRTLVRAGGPSAAGGRVYAQVGGGIVADSDPALEYDETLHKGRALFQALNAANFDEIMQGALHAQR